MADNLRKYSCWKGPTKLFALDGREIGQFYDLANLRWYVGALASLPADDVSFDDRYDASGDCVEFVVVKGIGDVGTLDRPVPQGWERAHEH